MVTDDNLVIQKVNLLVDALSVEVPFPFQPLLIPKINIQRIITHFGRLGKQSQGCKD